MAILARSLIKKAGYDNGFEIVQKSATSVVSLCSSLHPIRVDVTEGSHEGTYTLQFTGNLCLPELKRGLNKEIFLHEKIEVWNRDLLGVVIKRAAELGMSLPDSPIRHYNEQLETYLVKNPDEHKIFDKTKNRCFWALNGNNL